MKKLVCTIALVGASAAARAQTDSSDTGKLTISGYLDSYYLTAFNNPKSGNLLGVDQLAGRAFDRLPDQFALGLVQAKLAYSNRKSDLVIDLTFGPNAELGNFGNTTGAFNLYRPVSPYVASLYGTSAAIKQAYFTYRILPKLSATVGQFGTHIGYEVIDAPLNYHYSLSHLFNNGPFYHLGLKVAYAFNDKTSLMVGLVNNWDNLDTLDVFPCHGIGGMVGMIMTGIFASKAVNSAAVDGLAYGGTHLFMIHLLALVLVSAFAFAGSLALLKLTDLIIPLRVSAEEETLGLDVSQHEEQLLATT